MRIIQLAAGGLFALFGLVALSTMLPQSTSALQSAPNAKEHAQTAAANPLLTAPPAVSAPIPLAQTSVPDTTAIETAWRAWMTRHGVDTSAIAIGMNGAIITGAGQGRTSDQAYPVASLSKAVTAMCLNTILAQSDHSWDTPLSELTPVWNTLGMAPHAELAKLPLSALVTHTSGLPKNIGSDGTAGEGRNMYTQANFARAALRDPAHLPASRGHLYSNVNFALLGQIIEGFTGQSYGDYCQAAVMAPADARTAQVAGRMWATAGFGGWSISAADYARFAMHWYAPARPWMQRPADFAYNPDSGAGLGVFHRTGKGTHTLNHSGLWRSKTPARRIGALFVMGTNGSVFVANWQGSLPSEAYADLRKSVTVLLH
ncbi:serine hydrolase domain-containing protein [uncultured Sulfitobacter sp.]|uniref:serine hydrolase domain-containing protein n=1 Tax=uncultured Sulfitobacter sp. TaxID=191468 RepID=UPI0026096070|nr:serine hydrolase domain-containing protein [uncultured Sulfitobacter sp.]